jgi:hypothetical protein
MVAFREGNKTLCYIRVPHNEISPIIDAEDEQRKAHNAATRGRYSSPHITEEPSPHPWMDPIINRAKFQNETIEKICGACPDCGECTISKEPGATEYCGKLRKALV